VADRPILFSAPMIQALLAGRKTQTRRILRQQPKNDAAGCAWRIASGYKKTKVDAPYVEAVRPTSYGATEIVVPPLRILCRPGDRLWVRETLIFDSGRNDWLYGADQSTMVDVCGSELETPTPDRWPLLRCNSIHMPRWASRLTLTVTDVRVQRLQDISEADAIAEGGEHDGFGAWLCYAAEPKPQTHWACPRESYRTLWTAINGPGAWKENPWVGAYTFTVHRENIDSMARLNLARDAALREVS
jgi:hypothetical protein